MPSPQVIVLEFNELCPPLLEEFMGQGLLPNFSRLYKTSQVFTSAAGESDPNLEPWIQWLTVHSGMTYSEHGAFHLGEGSKLEHKCVGQVLSDAGVPTGIFESMNVNYRELNGYMIPDAWDQVRKPHPPALEPFYNFVASKVRDVSKGDRDTSGFVPAGWFLMRNGLQGKTIKRALSHLAAEKRDPELEWRRASILDWVQYDLFRTLNRKKNIRFSTFFANSTAHYQHYFWRHMDPSAFSDTGEEQPHWSLPGAVQYGYESMDGLLGRVFEDFPDARVVLCSALSQQAWDTQKRTYRPRDFDRFLNLAHIDPDSVRIRPVMAEQFYIDCADQAQADEIEKKCKALSLDGDQLMHLRPEGKSVFTGCRITRHDVEGLKISGGSAADTPFLDMFHPVHVSRSGRHNPDGVFWVQDPQPQVHQEQVPLVDLAPTLLNLFDIPAPPHMKGRSLSFN